MIVCLWDVLKCPFSLVSDTESTKVFFNSFQNISKNYFVNPLLPGGLLFCMLFRESCKSFLVKSSSQRFALSSENIYAFCDVVVNYI